MRVIQTVNDTIRLLFNPKTEVFSLSDFLLVRDSNENFLGQVVEVYDDKFDQEANVAKIKLIYKIVNGNELLPYNNYTPSRECEVAKVKQSEIEKCINLNKKTVKIGKSFKSEDETEININFFENNPVIFSDKYEQTNRIFENLAGKLSEFKPVIILDFSGACQPEKDTKFIAGENFKIPLSSKTIDYIRQKVLLRAKMGTQVILGDIFDEVREFLETSIEDYVPYSRFVKVIQSQCKTTPSVELLVLISWLKKYARMNVFAKNKKEFETFLKSTKKNKVTTVDFSGVKIEWQKEYLEYIINSLDNDVFLFIRLNDNNINNEILNSIYLKKPNISLIPSFAYGYKKASYIMEFAHNYILTPTLNPKRDFTNANFQIQSLNKDSYMVFGDDTKDFIFIVENTSKIKRRREEDPKTDGRLLISLNLQLDEMMPLELMTDNFELKPAPSKKKRLQEEIKLSDILNDKPKNTEDNIKEDEKKENILGEDELDYFNNEELVKEEPEIVSNENIEEDYNDVIEDENLAPVDEAIEEENEDELADEIVDNILKEENLKEESLDIEEEFEEENQNSLDEEYSDENEEYEDSQVELTENASNDSLEEEIEADFDELGEDIPAEDIQKEIVIEPEEVVEEVPKEKPAKKASAKKEAPIENIQKEALVEADEVVEEVPKEKPAKKTSAKKEVPLEEAPIEKTIKEESDEPEQIEPKAEPKAESGAKAKKEASKEKKNTVDEVQEKTPKKTSKASKMPKIKEIKEKDEAKIGVDGKKEATPLEKFAKLEEASEDDDIEDETGEEKEVLDDSLLDAIDEANFDNKTIKDTETTVSSIVQNVIDENKAKEKEEKKEDEEEIDRQFEKIINEEQKSEDKKNVLKINEKVSIDLEKIKQGSKSKEQKLPIFDEEETTVVQENVNFKEGNMVICEKYGTGKILKVIKYGERCLLQIDFPEIGKRLLDTKIAKIKLAN